MSHSLQSHISHTSEPEDKLTVEISTKGRTRETIEMNHPTGLGVVGYLGEEKDLEDRWLKLPGNLSPTVDGVLKDVGEDCLRTVVRWYIDC